MIFVLDVGNTNAVLGVFEEGNFVSIGAWKQIVIRQKMNMESL